MNIAELGQNQILGSRITVGMIFGLPITRPWLKYGQRMVEGKADASSDSHINEPPIFAAGHALVELVKARNAHDHPKEKILCLREQ